MALEVTGDRIVETKGQVFGLVVRSRGLGGNIMAGFRSLGGRGDHRVYDSSEIGNTMSEIVAYVTAAIVQPAGVLTGLVFYLCINGAIVIAALVFERGRYRPTVTPGGSWEETGERFVDPTTGRLMKVRYNPQTGAPGYVRIGPQPDAPPQGETDTTR